jgi:alpha-glucosidase
VTEHFHLRKLAVCWACCSSLAFSQGSQIRLVHDPDVVEVQAVAPNIVRLHIQPGGKASPRTLVIDPSFQPIGIDKVRVDRNGAAQTLSSPEMRVVVDDGPEFSVQVQDARAKTLVTVKRDPQPGRGQQRRGTVIIHDQNENLYGFHALGWHDSDPGILRNLGGTVAAGFQGDGGAPFFFTTKYGVLVDSDGGSFQTVDDTIRFQRGSRPDAEYFVIVGPPMKTMAGVAMLTGRPPMPPKWTLGFLNSQWGSTEEEWRKITETYEQKSIPVSGYILDYDWKAWGEDDYGEWRWNSTSGEGNVSPNKFPDGASGKFASDLLAHGIHLAGILKPRVIVNRPDGQPTKASAYATEHNFWYPDEVRDTDPFSRRVIGNIDFGNPDARKWYWEHLEPAFRSGITAWWNDEADQHGNTLFNNFQFLNMGRMLYEGQRSISNERVWSINRNYYLGAIRYGYAEWSGDITTGFQSMAYQRRRMVATVNLGESAWSMDIGGFVGHPAPENYARWVEFGAFVPIFRLHGGNNEKRQPWVYGPIAESAARKAVRLRYDLMPYIYSNARVAYETGIGIVRPLFWEFPDEENCSTETRAWMFGDALLVSPIAERNVTLHKFYLPPGTWFDYFSGKPVEGGREMAISPDTNAWQDIPLYVRAGSILATQPTEHGNELRPATPLVLDVFPSPVRTAKFLAYDDDGHSYDYEKGGYFRQEITATRSGRATNIEIAAASGAYKPHFPSYLLRVHQASAGVTNDGRMLTRFPSANAFESSSEPGWFSTTDRFGGVADVRIGTDAKPHALKLALR